MLLEPPKSCTQVTCIVPVVPCVQNKLPLKKRHNEIRDFNWHRFHSHFKGLGQALVRGKIEKEKMDCSEGKKGTLSNLDIQQEVQYLFSTFPTTQ